MCEEIWWHCFYWKRFYAKLVLFYSIFDKTISDRNVWTLVILVYYPLLNILYFCFKKIRRYILYGTYLLTPNTSNCVVLLALNFCLDLFSWTMPHFKDIAPPRCPLMFGCTTCDVSIHVSNLNKSSITNIIW